jgi:asparagine N-glycosylation enzyme membrane subunit Stt3
MRAGCLLQGYHPDREVSMSRQAQYLIIWVIGSLIAALLALQLTSAAYVDGVWLPVGNDSFYHARRILDAAQLPGGLYQFDPSIHVPEGSWLTWPWAYDWSMAGSLQLMQWLRPTTDAMAFLTHVPVYWVFVNMTSAGYTARPTAKKPGKANLSTYLKTFPM